MGRSVHQFAIGLSRKYTLCSVSVVLFLTCTTWLARHVTAVKFRDLPWLDIGKMGYRGRFISRAFILVYQKP